MTTRLLLTFAILTTTALARLGETERELTERFEKPTLRQPEKRILQGKMVPIGELLRFQQGDWNIAATIIEGRCARIHYHKKGEWSEEQISQTLNANSQGSPWTMTSRPTSQKIKREWIRVDKGTATWTPFTGLELTNPAYDRAIAKAQAKAKAESRKTPNI